MSINKKFVLMIVPLAGLVAAGLLLTWADVQTRAAPGQLARAVELEARAAYAGQHALELAAWTGPLVAAAGLVASAGVVLLAVLSGVGLLRLAWAGSRALELQAEARYVYHVARSLGRTTAYFLAGPDSLVAGRLRSAGLAVLDRPHVGIDTFHSEPAEELRSEPAEGPRRPAPTAGRCKPTSRRRPRPACVTGESSIPHPDG